MGWIVLRWFGLAVALWGFINLVIRAFQAPWTWTFAQCLVVFFAGLILVTVAIWLRLWRTSGGAGVRERAALVKASLLSPPAHPRRNMTNLVVWIVIAGALVVAFNVMH